MLSTCHSSDMIEKRRRTRAITGGTEVISKPQMVKSTTSTWGELTGQTSRFYIIAMLTGLANGGRGCFFSPYGPGSGQCPRSFQ